MSTEKKALISLFAVVATELIGFGLIIPILPQIAFKFESSPFLIGILMASYSFAQFIAAPILGSWSDKIGRKPVLLISKFGSVIAYIVLGLSQSFGLFLIARLLDGFTGGNIAVARAYISDITTEKNRGKGMAIIGISFGLGFVLGPALGGLLYGSKYGHTLPAFVAGALSFIAFLLTVFILKEPNSHKANKERLPFRNILSIHKKSILGILLSYFIYMMVFSGFESTFSLFTHQIFNFNEKQNSLLFMYVGILAILIQGSIARKSIKQFTGLLTFAFAITAISFLFIALSTTIPLLYISLALLSLGIGLINSYLPALLSTKTEKDQLGATMGLYESIGSLSRILGPFLAFLIVLKYPKESYILFSIILTLAGYLFYHLVKEQKKI
ncbi:MAG: MFS transporter [bacterium]